MLLGIGLGGGIGYYLGRTTGSEPCPEQPKAQSTAADKPQDPALAGDPKAVVVPKADPAVDGMPGEQGSPDQKQAKTQVHTLSASISGSLYATLARQLEGREADILSAHIGRLLVWWLNARKDVLRGDSVEVAWEPVPGPGKIRILALRYQSSKLGKTFSAYIFQPTGSPYGRYFDERGQEIENRLVDSPIEEYEQITELMNLAGRKHRGVDFKTDVGTPIKATERARIMRRNWRTRGNGFCLQVSYPSSGRTAMFLHLDRVADSAKPGKLVEAGTVIAYSGNTGHSTAPHLHYELRDKNGQLLNPFEAHETHRVQLADEQLATFQKNRVVLEGYLQGAADGKDSGAKE